MQFNKSFFKSKTLWVNLLAIVGLMFPDVQDAVKDSPELVMSAFAVVNGILRLFTKKALVVKEEPKITV